MVVDTIRRFLRRERLAPAAMLAAVSGGVDSTALLLALADLRTEGWRVVAAHVNHHLRGAESDGDEAFVRDLCARLGIELLVADGALDPEAVKHRGVEAAAREVRFARLHELRERAGARSIATAHQRDDQAETILMRLTSGGGLGALRGIRAVRDDGVIRPLLDVSRAEIEAFLRERGVTPRIDRSNADPRFLRNRIRALLRELDPSVSSNLAALAAQVAQQWPFLERAIDDAEQTSAEVREDETRFTTWPSDPWLRQALLHRHILRLDPTARDVSAADLARLAAEVDAIKRVSVTRELELFRRDGALLLRRKPEPTPEFEVDLTPDAPAFIPEAGVVLHVRATQQPSNPATQPIQLPEGAQPHFTVRNRRPGDRFRPLGMQADKKLKELLIDRKIAAEVRDRIPLLIWNGEIVWIAGVEVSDRFKVTSRGGALYEVWTEQAGASLEENHEHLHG